MRTDRRDSSGGHVVCRVCGRILRVSPHSVPIRHSAERAVRPRGAVGRVRGREECSLTCPCARAATTNGRWQARGPHHLRPVRWRVPVLPLAGSAAGDAHLLDVPGTGKSRFGLGGGRRALRQRRRGPVRQSRRGGGYLDQITKIVAVAVVNKGVQGDPREVDDD